MDEVDDDEHGTATLTLEADGTAVIAVEGEIDLSSGDTVSAAIIHAVDCNCTRLVFDMSEVRFMDSSGFSALLESRTPPAPVLLRKPSHAVRRLIETTGLGDVMQIEP